MTKPVPKDAASGATNDGPSPESDPVDLPPDTVADLPSPTDVPAVRVRTDAFDGWLGGSCNVNADCADSPAAAAVLGLHCPTQTFCLGGLCHSECNATCVPAGDDSTTCLPPRFCVAFSTSGGMGICRITPLKCATEQDCPLPSPSLDASPSWFCDNGTCAHPGFEYPTR